MDAEIPMLEDQRIGTDRSSQPPSPVPDAPTGKQNPKLPVATYAPAQGLFPWARRTREKFSKPASLLAVIPVFLELYR
jgi:hypothetical protein